MIPHPRSCAVLAQFPVETSLDMCSNQTRAHFSSLPASVCLTRHDAMLFLHCNLEAQSKVRGQPPDNHPEHIYPLSHPTQFSNETQPMRAKNTQIARLHSPQLRFFSNLPNKRAICADFTLTKIEPSNRLRAKSKCRFSGATDRSDCRRSVCSSRRRRAP